VPSTRLWQDGDPIIMVDIDTHRWYAVVTVTHESGEKVVKVIGVQAADGIGVYESYEEWERANYE